MCDLGIEAFTVASRTHTDYLSLADFAALHPDALPMRRLEPDCHDIPPEHLMVAAPQHTATDSGEQDVSALALGALGVPAVDQPLFLVRGALRDPMVAVLAGLVHGSGWGGEDVGITHLEELGGTVVFGLLEWAVPTGAAATVVICDEPILADGRVGSARFAAVGLRVRRGGGGAVRVLGFAEGAPGAVGAEADHRFTGSGPCDAWMDFHEALVAGGVGDGDRVLLRVRAPLREGWALLEVTDTARLRLTDGVREGERIG